MLFVPCICQSKVPCKDGGMLTEDGSPPMNVCKGLMTEMNKPKRNVMTVTKKTITWHERTQ